MPPSNRKKLVLHFDIRNTMIVADTVTSITVEQALNAYLTGVLWGREVDGERWEWACDTPSLTQPQPGTTTYYKHLEKMIVKTPPDRTKLRLAVGDFVHTEFGRKFESYYKEALEQLEWKYDGNHHKKLVLKGTDDKKYHYVLPSFYKLLSKLHKDERDFAIVIRTFGLDCENVLDSISTCLKVGAHPEYPNLPDMELHPHEGRVLRDDDTITLQINRCEGKVEEITTDDQIYEYFCNTKGISGFVDDFQFWQEMDYHHNYAKPLWIDPADRQHQHILFDDNYRLGDMDNIVNMREKQGDSWVSLTNECMAMHDPTSLVQVDLLEAIGNENYYIDKVRRCEKNFDRYTAQRLKQSL